MNIQLLSCSAKRPDKRAISKMLVEYADGMDASLADELTGYLLEGTPIDIEVSDNSSSAFRAIRKLDIDYEIQELSLIHI